MKSRRLWTMVRMALALGAALPLIEGCELLLDTSDLKDRTDGGTDATAGPDTGAPDSGRPPVDAGADVAGDGFVADQAADALMDGGVDAPVDASLDCSGVDGGHVCGSSCVPNDMNHCGPSCLTCNPTPPNATAACDGTKCTIVCNANFADCADSGTGCATSLQSNSNCGACGNDCANSPEGHVCGTLGSARSEQCSCSAAGDCPSPPNGTLAICSAEVCGTSCMAGWRNNCPMTLDSGVSVNGCGCGASCSACPANQGCADGGCTPCGSAGQPCCAGNTCPSTTTQICGEAGTCQ